MTRLSQDRRRVSAACVCLLGVALLYAPLAGAAWAGHAMTCCAADHCNIPQHHHQKTPARLASSGDCEHDGRGLAACSMSCCQNPDNVVVTAMIFVLPQLSFASAAIVGIGVPEFAHALEIPRSIEPLSPPPRVTRAAL